ncbi:MBL fold metallo-hydrolase [Flavobacteriaceae bacterium D16]|nr:MBL fold metallo-hydrolase [Flavobacteriaceae bacterium D16]
MKITHYLYNAFLIESGDKKLAIDPGGLMFYYFRFSSLIPITEWKDITHIFVTHGDPDHYWHTDRMAAVSHAPVICNKTMVKEVDGKHLLLGPRDKGVVFTTEFQKYQTLSVDETIEVDGMSITGIKTTHGPLTIKLGPFSKTLKPGPEERIGWGAIGFKIQMDGKTLVNLGDTLLHKEEWKSIDQPDVLMIPIGGKAVHNTMDIPEALKAIQIMRPKMVIPCHYNCPAFFSKSFNHADEDEFRNGIEAMEIPYSILHRDESVHV